MKLILLLLVCLLVTAALSERRHKRRYKKRLLEKLAEEERLRAEIMAEEAVEEGNEYDDNDEEEEKNGLFDEDDEEDDQEEEDDVEEDAGGRSPCETKKCGRGQECYVKDQKALCKCTARCIIEGSDRYRVCSRHNETFESECALDRQYCICSKNLDGCLNKKYKGVHIDYYGPCKKLSKCKKYQLEDFRSRVVDWLFRVMNEMKQRKMLGTYESWLAAAKAEKKHEHAVVWRFCDLDSKPRDQHMSRRELLFTIRSLKGMEHCLVPFLDDCDQNKDRKISLPEWERCLDLDENEVPEKCQPIVKN